MNAGQIVRRARQKRNMTLTELGLRCGYSASQISRFERGLARLTDIGVLGVFSAVLEIPPQHLGLATPFPPDAHSLALDSHRVGWEESGKDDPMRRRSLLTAAGALVPAALLGKVDEALAVLPPVQSKSAVADVKALLGQGERRYAAGRLDAVLSGLPVLLASGHDLYERRDSEDAAATLADCYMLASDALHKAGAPLQARLTADRATTYAGISGDSVTRVAASQRLAVVLRHDGNAVLAADVTRIAAERLAAEGLQTGRQSRALALVLCTSAYSAAQAGDRDQAQTLLTEAGNAAHCIPDSPSDLRARDVVGAQVQLYRVGACWALGETGSALQAARGLHPGRFPTPERRARLFTDLARVHDQAGQRDRAMTALVGASKHAVSEVRNRASIRQFAGELVRQGPRTAASRQLAMILDGSPR